MADEDLRTEPHTEAEEAPSLESHHELLMQHAKMLSQHRDMLVTLNKRAGIKSEHGELEHEEDTPASARAKQRDKDYDRVSMRKRH